jgi:hypothetical protein
VRLRAGLAAAEQAAESALITRMLRSGPIAINAPCTLYGARRSVIESLIGMTSTTKRRIAREWLIFLVCIVIGLLVTYFAVYFGERVEMGLREIHVPGETPYPTPDNRPLTTKDIKDIISGRATPLPPLPQPPREAIWKYKNPGDLFNDLFPIFYTQPYHDWNEAAVKLWLCILSPYLGLCVVRSIIWSVNTLRRR